MCGIVGFSWEDRNAVRKACRKIAHRGPDDSGTSMKDGVSLGNVRLAVQDLSKKGHMPMERNHLSITFNGEIYNFRDVRKKLEQKGYKFTSGTDTEVILRAYEEWGADCLARLNGMFALCIHDKKSGKLFLARDRFGIKPLYYAVWGKGKEKRFSFCSEIKGLLDFLEEREVDRKGMEQFFTFGYTLGETTLVKGVKKLLPGYWMEYDLGSGKLKTGRWYELKKQEQSQRSFGEHKRLVREKLDESVKRRMVADVPVACLLSGGIDSSAITALAGKHGKKKLNTFSIGFDDSSETAYAKMVAEHLGTNHREFKVGRDNLLEYLENMVYHMDEPIADPGFLPIFILSKEVSKHNKVVLSGDGADEIFTGYDRYKMLHYGRFLRHFAFLFLPSLGMDIVERLKSMRGKDDFHAFLEIIRLFDSQELEALGLGEYDASALWERHYSKAVLNAQRFDIATLLPGDFFMKADKMSSAFGLEQRVPFMDHEIVELAFQIPLKHKLKLWKEKRVLKEAFEEELPEEIVKRRKYAFFVPIDYWFRNVLAEKLEKMLDESEHGLYEKKPVFELLKQVKGGGRKNYKEDFISAKKLWGVLVFEMWHNEFIE